MCLAGNQRRPSCLKFILIRSSRNHCLSSQNAQRTVYSSDISGTSKTKVPHPSSSLSTMLLLPGFALGLTCLPVIAQQSNLPTSSLSTSTSATTVVTGQVVNAVTGAPIYRALVQIDSHSQLSDHEGRFSLAFTSTSSPTVRINKPGYYATPEGDPNLSVNIAANQSGPLTTRLYPESLLTGTLTASDGTPLQDVVVTPERSVYSESGHQWTPMPPRQTNSRGEFRLAVPAGDYRLQIGAGRRMPFGGQMAIPQTYPSSSSTEGSSFIHLASGAEEHLNLRAEVSSLYPVPVRIEPGLEDGFASITAITETGARIPANSTPGPSGAPMSIELPRGSFTLIASRNRGDQTEYAEARVDVNGPTSTPVILRLAPVPAIPVVVNVDHTTSTSDNAPPTLQQLALSLSSASAPGFGAGRGFSPGNLFVRDNNTSLRPLPGTYHLLSQARGTWHIQSATYGANDLLQHDLVVALGSGSAPIVITVSDQSGSLTGTASLQGAPQSVWVYLVPSFPSAIPFYSVRSSSTGVFAFSNLPPGSYQALAFELHRQVDFRSPSVLSPYSTYIHNLTIAAGDKASLELEAVPASEIQP